jgi:diacylglycerol kinase (ATP)
MIDVGQVAFTKKIIIIYNPSSGYSYDRRGQIAETLESKDIKYDLYVTTGHNDAIDKVRAINIDDYCAIVAVGGDGTCHEVVNGLLTRSDKKKLPVCFLPNGSGNDLSLTTFDLALQAL